MGDPTIADAIRVEDQRDDLPTIIPSALDDYGLTPEEFRVYCRYARRAGGRGGKSYESIRRMARELGMSDKTIREATAVLNELCLVKVVPQGQAQPPHVYLLSASRWQPPVYLDDARRKHRRPSGKKDREDAVAATAPDNAVAATAPMQSRRPHACGRGDPQRSPGKESNKESTSAQQAAPQGKAPAKNKTKIPDPPEELTAAPGWAEAWKAWCSYRTERRIPITRQAATMQYNKLLGFIKDGYSALECVNYSIDQGYRSIFAPPKLDARNSQGPVNQPPKRDGSVDSAVADLLGGIDEELN